jgi:AraC-like DNA-binding protein
VPPIPAIGQLLVAPTPALRPYVTSYVGFDVSGPPGVHLGVPSRALVAVISLSDPLHVSASCFSAMAGGLTTRSVAIRHEGRLHGVKLSLTPLGARALYGRPASALSDDLVPLVDLLGHFGAELVERLGAAVTWSARFAALDDLLLRVVRRAENERDVRLVRPEVLEAWGRLVASCGRLRVASLASELGWSRRHLSREFRAEFGLTPKTAARVLRFERAHQLATAAESLSWAEVSTDAGYTDQAHLVRDWGEFTGCSPAAWRRAEVLVGAAQ